MHVVASEIWDRWMEARAEVTNLKANSVTWGHVTRGRQRERADAMVEAEAILRRSSDYLARAADRITR